MRTGRHYRRLFSQIALGRRSVQSQLDLQQSPLVAPRHRHPERRDHLFQVIEWIGWDKLLFATDYPHWDFDDPSRVLPAGVSDANR